MNINKRIIIAISLVIIVCSLVFTFSLVFLRVYNEGLFVQISPPSEWRTLYSVINSTDRWADIKSVAMGVVNTSIFFHIRWQSDFPENLRERNEDYYWNQVRRIVIKWVVQNHNYSLEIVPGHPDPETGIIHFNSELRGSLSSRHRSVYELCNLTECIIGLQLLTQQEHPILGRSILSVPWEESQDFQIYQGFVDAMFYERLPRLLWNDIPLVTTPPVMDGQAEDWLTFSRQGWDLAVPQSQSSNLLRNISLIRSNEAIYLLLQFQKPYLSHFQSFHPDYNLSSQLLINLVGKAENLEHDYNFNILTNQNRNKFSVDITHLWDTGGEMISLPSSDFGINESIELTYYKSNIDDIWESSTTWDIYVSLGQFLWFSKRVL